jgi:hypothetical protein
MAAAVNAAGHVVADIEQVPRGGRSQYRKVPASLAAHIEHVVAGSNEAWVNLGVESTLGKWMRGWRAPAKPKGRKPKGRK